MTHTHIHTLRCPKLSTISNWLTPSFLAVLVHLIVEVVLRRIDGMEWNVAFLHAHGAGRVRKSIVKVKKNPVLNGAQFRRMSRNILCFRRYRARRRAADVACEVVGPLGQMRRIVIGTKSTMRCWGLLGIRWHGREICMCSVMIAECLAA
jgi:hypothetical protein